jgi:NAD-dependent deacetylase
VPSLPAFVPDRDRFPRLVVLSGAGLSAAAGLGTFRGEDGLWTIAPDLERAMHADLLPDSLPDLWRVWGGMFRRAAAAGPTPGHRALAAMGALVLTQNVDTLHQRAGSEDVVELHGSAARATCLAGCPWSAALAPEGPVPPVPAGDRAEDYGVPARCPRCGAPSRPDVVLFGESLPAAALDRAVEAATACDLFVSVGTSGTVAPASALAPIAKESGAVTVNLDRDARPSTVFDHVVRADAQLVLPAWAAARA